jgi:hypothetical protein
MSDYPLPISQVIDPSTTASERGTFLERLHGWVVTVDHKRLGILYILYSTFFLLVAGAEALMIRIQLSSFSRSNAATVTRLLASADSVAQFWILWQRVLRRIN